MKELESKFRGFFDKVKDATYLNKDISVDVYLITDREGISITYVPLTNIKESTVISYYRDNGEIRIGTNYFDLEPTLTYIWEQIENKLSNILNTVSASKVARISQLKSKQQEIEKELNRLENEK